MKSFAFALLVVLGCGTSDKGAPPAGGSAAPTAVAPAGVAAPTPAAPTPAAPTPAAPVAPPAPEIVACSLLSPAEVGAVFGKTVVATGSLRSCSYGLDPAEQQKAMAELTKGGAAAMMAKGGGIKIPSVLSNQLAVEVSIERDAQTEDEIKKTYASIGATVNGAAKPEQHGMKDTIVAGKDLPNVCEWAFSTNVASINMGNGISTRGRLLEARQGGWRLTVSVTIAPDPGEAKLDDELAALARPACAKLK